MNIDVEVCFSGCRAFFFFFFSPLSGCCVNSGRWEGEEIWICCFCTSGVFIFRWLGLRELRSFTFQIQKNVLLSVFVVFLS